MNVLCDGKVMEENNKRKSRGAASSHAVLERIRIFFSSFFFFLFSFPPQHPPYFTPLLPPTASAGDVPDYDSTTAMPTKASLVSYFLFSVSGRNVSTDDSDTRPLLFLSPSFHLPSTLHRLSCLPSSWPQSFTEHY